jgi:hypothetical protein
MHNALLHDTLVYRHPGRVYTLPCSTSISDTSLETMSSDEAVPLSTIRTSRDDSRTLSVLQVHRLMTRCLLRSTTHQQGPIRRHYRTTYHAPSILRGGQCGTVRGSTTLTKRSCGRRQSQGRLSVEDRNGRLSVEDSLLPPSIFD